MLWSFFCKKPSLTWGTYWGNYWLLHSLCSVPAEDLRPQSSNLYVRAHWTTRIVPQWKPVSLDDKRGSSSDFLVRRASQPVGDSRQVHACVVTLPCLVVTSTIFSNLLQALARPCKVAVELDILGMGRGDSLDYWGHFPDAVPTQTALKPGHSKSHSKGFSGLCSYIVEGQATRVWGRFRSTMVNQSRWSPIQLTVLYLHRQ